MTVLESLEAVRALLSNPEKFTRRVHARDAHQWVVPPRSPKAVCWCLDGALLYVGARQRAGNVMNAIARELGFRDRVALNDDGGYELVLRALDIAIEREREKVNAS